MENWRTCQENINLVKKKIKQNQMNNNSLLSWRSMGKCLSGGAVCYFIFVLCERTQGERRPAAFPANAGSAFSIIAVEEKYSCSTWNVCFLIVYFSGFRFDTIIVISALIATIVNSAVESRMCCFDLFELSDSWALACSLENRSSHFVMLETNSGFIYWR